LPNEPFSQRAPAIVIVNRSSTPITVENLTVGAYERGKPRRGFVWGVSSRTIKYIHADKVVELPTVLGPGEMIRLDFDPRREYVEKRNDWRFGIALTHSLSDKYLKRLLPP
jgi:hypothetical protein